MAYGFNIQMPDVSSNIGDIPLPELTPILVRDKDTKELSTVFLVPYNKEDGNGKGHTVIWFDGDGCICHSDVDYLRSEFTIIRKYNTGERLTVISP